jgi:recombination protein RecT
MTQLQKSAPKTPVQFFEQASVQSKFESMLGKRAPQFITSVLQVVNSNKLLKSADPITIYTAAATAATMNLPINNNLGFAYIVPYKGQAQFQIGWKGFVQLAQRSGQFRTISSCEVYEGQVKSEDPLKGVEFDWSAKTSDKVVGYAAYFELLTGFQKTLYMTVEQVQKHAGKYSQMYKKGFGVWKDDFDAMAKKTVLKLLLSKYAPLSIEMQNAVIADQSVVKDVDGMEVEYIDNDIEEVDPEQARALAMIDDCTTIAELDNLHKQLGDDFDDKINARKEALK